MNIQEENGQIIVDELRPMSEARAMGINRCLALLVSCPEHFHLIERECDKYWSDGEDDWLSDDEFVGFMPLPIYRPKDAE